MKVSVVRYQDLPQNEKLRQPNNGAGKWYANYLKVDFGGDDIEYFSDAAEPEDATLTRDFGWVKDVIMRAYEFGKAGK